MIERRNEEIEIMAPVGSMETLSAAIEARTNSIYFGVDRLNMRSHSAANFKIADMQEVVTRCHDNDIKCYLTLNTIIYPEDIDLMRKTLEAAKKEQVDAIIASDIAVLEYAKHINMPTHISTQVNICNVEAIKHFAQYADVMVLARELNIEQVKKIKEDLSVEKVLGCTGQPIRLEMFCHGALCMAVSGKCYMSLDNANKSANRGECVQICRRAYEVTDAETGQKLKIDNKYILSPKDLCTIHFLNRILDAGVRVLKIEGRARDARYVYTTISCYREAVEAWKKGLYDDNDAIEAQIRTWKQRLQTVFNRDFWDGYYLGQRMGEWTHNYGNQAEYTKIYVGKCTNFFTNISVAEFKVEAVDCISENDNLLITGKTIGVYETRATNLHNQAGDYAKQIHQGEFFSIKTSRPIHRGDMLYRLVKTKR